jgi:hypothetical protein
MQELKGNFPPELKAITLKAMAYKQRDRYQTIVEMEEDLLKYQMGYSVSAKKDNALELLMKFYQRNKLLSAVSLSFLLIFLVGSIVFIISLQGQRNKATAALAKVELALKKFEKEKTDRMIDNKNSAPTYFAKAHEEAQLDNYQEAEKLMDIAVNYDSENQAYKLYRGCLFIANNKFANAKADLETIKNHPQQSQIAKILKIINDPSLKTLSEKDKIALSEICAELKILDVSQKLTTNLLKKFELWNNQLKVAWPKEIFVFNFKNNTLTFKIENSNENLDLSPLKGIPIQSLTIINCPNLSNLTALETLPLESLHISRCPLLIDISVLKNAKLNHIFLENTKISDLSALANPELHTLILKSNPITTLKPILNLPIKEIELFNIYLTNNDELKSLPLESFSSFYSNIESLEKINVKNLKTLRIASRLLDDISLLKAANLEVLEISNCNVTNLSPIKNKNIKYLNIGGCDNSNFEVILTLKNLEILILQPNSLQPGWEDILIKMKDQLKSVGVGPGSYQKSVNQFIKEYKGINNKNPKR